MKSRTGKRYPSKSRMMFDGGLNNKFEKSTIPENQSPDCLNVIFTDGAVETRGGSSKMNTTTVGSFAAQGIYTRHDDAGTQTMTAWWNGSMYTYNGTSFTTQASAQSVFTAATRVYSAEYENHAFYGNGGSVPYKYGGSGDEFTRHGVYTASATASIATAATGSALTGEFSYAITNVNTNLVESDYTTLGTFTADSENAALTSLPVMAQSFGVDTRNLYRTVTSGSTFLRLATISDNTTTTYDDAISDSSLGVAAPDDNGVPPNYSSIVYHGSRLFFIDPADHLIKYSEIGNPYVVKATSFLRLGDNSGDKPKAFAVYDNSLMVFCEQNPWIIYMGSTTPSEWRVLRVRATYGCRSPLGPFSYENKVMFPAISAGKFVGFSAIQGQTVSPSASILTNSAVGSEMQSQAVEPDMILVNEGAVEGISSFVFENKAYMTLPYGVSQTTNNRIYVFDFSYGRLKKQDPSWVPWTGISAYNFAELDGKLYSQSSIDNGFVYELNTTTYNDDSVAIDSYYWTKELSGFDGDENVFKDYRDAQIFYELSGGYKMNLNARTDSDLGSGNQYNVDLDPGGTLWNTGVWGNDNWSAGQGDDESKVFVAPIRGKRIQFKFSNQNAVNQKFKVLGMRFSYNVKGIR